MLDNRLKPAVAPRVPRPRLVLPVAILLLVATGPLIPIQALGAQSDLTVTAADAGIDSYAESGLETTATLAVETFDSRNLVNNGTINISSTVGTFSGTGFIFGSGVYGGANSQSGTQGRFATASGNTITLTLPGTGNNHQYLGFWWSAGNSDNHVDIVLADGSVGATFTVGSAGSANSLASLVGACGPNPPTNAYCGNPNYSPRAVPTEQYAFVHLRYPPGFRQIRFRGTGFEFDNVTISQTLPALASTETNVVTFNPYTISTASVLLADLSSTQVSFPGLTLGAGSGETNAMLCFRQVLSNGTNVATATLQSTGSGSGITTSNSGGIQTYSGTRTAITTFSSNINIQPVPQGGIFGAVESRYIRVTATPQTNLGSAGCTGDATASVVIEIRFIRPLRLSSLNVPID